MRELSYFCKGIESGMLKNAISAETTSSLILGLSTSEAPGRLIFDMREDGPLKPFGCIPAQVYW